MRRAVTRWGGDDASDDLAKQLVALVCSLRGSVCLYQGEELGLTEAEVPFESLQDPYGIAFWPNFKGRDGCRTPMPWNGGAHAGFSQGKPWLPVAATHSARSVAVQDAQADSVLNGVRHLMRWRKTHPALVAGDIAFLDAPEPMLSFTRHARRRDAAGGVQSVAAGAAVGVAATVGGAGTDPRPRAAGRAHRGREVASAGVRRVLCARGIRAMRWASAE